MVFFFLNNEEGKIELFELSLLHYLEEKEFVQQMDYTVLSLSKHTVYAMQRHTRGWSTDPVLWG